MTKKLCIIFDWDGTLIDSSPCVIQAHHRAADTLGMPKHDMTKLSSMLGQPSEVVSQLLTEKTEFKAIDYQSCFREEYKRLSHSVELYGFSQALVKRLYETGLKCAIATNKPAKIAKHEIQRTGLFEYFVQKEYACQSKAKPDPSMLKTIALSQGVEYQQCLMIGDQTNDADAAQSLGMDCIIVYDEKLPAWHREYGIETKFVRRGQIIKYMEQIQLLEPEKTSIDG